MPGASLQRACRLLVAVCALHLGVTLVYYLVGRDLSRLPQLEVWEQASKPGSETYSTVLLPPEGPEIWRRARRFLPLFLWIVYSTVGPMLIEFNIPVDLKLVEEQNPKVKVGGRYTPKDCISPHKVAIIIPFRNRQEHLKYWLYYLHPILQRQQLDYGIYVINQAGESMFNRAKLLNVGFKEALKDYEYNCFVFSDVDLIPMNDRNTYRCFSQPRHISVAMDKFGFSLPYVQYFGGVSALSKQQFLTINGFPNNYWGWGGEDDDIFNRFDRIAHTKETMLSDGLNTLTYLVLDVQRFPLYTEITVDIGTPS
ncbi:hypothetical protein E2I00_019306 [Balaenoptera physalus]|uniref:Beta-1,4-galactosyltransferase n=1 Tax=Balaenoptera physalus TaxID=9770 RepID=A0A643BY39_BALPH|nr:hypothetical protein E2I00_019306 [Balaenoptera physalus]